MDTKSTTVTEFTPGEKDYESLLSEGITIVEQFRDDHWRLGDWGAKVEDLMGRKMLKDMAVQTGESVQVVTQCVWVARSFPDKKDRVTDLSWSHYRAAAGTDTPYDWIDWAVDNAATVKTLTDAIKNESDKTNEKSGYITCGVCTENITGDGYYLRHKGKEIPICGPACLLAYAEQLVELMNKQAEESVVANE